MTKGRTDDGETGDESFLLGIVRDLKGPFADLRVERSGAAAAAGEADGALAPGTPVGRYLVVRFVGRGAMGEVYAGYDPELDRKVALKILRPGPVGSTTEERGRARLLREAQALARLSHPNVVAVHDVGTFGEQVFLAMEFVAGGSLRQWLTKRPRSAREVLRVFEQAGRGLAAAHAAGLIHRDFKPENVLLGEDGRVRVADFGLARAISKPADDVPDFAPCARSASDPSLTQAGAVLGTPAYMAPEQRAGGAVDARVDQFSFCVSLSEALGAEGVSRPRLPARVRRALERGMRSEPADRFASMDVLVGAIAVHPQRTLVMVLAAIAALGLGTAGVLAGWLPSREGARLCRMGAGQLAGVWDAERKAEIQAAFHRTGVPYAAGAWSSVERAFDAHAARWVATYTDACEATHVRGEQSTELLDLRMSCLREVQGEARALSELLARADAALVESAGRAAAALPALDRCGNALLLKGVIPLPSDPAAQGRVAAVRRQIDEAKALQRAGRFSPGLAQARQAAEAALRIGHPPLAAESLVVRGQLEMKTGDDAAADRTLDLAVTAAERSRDDMVKARALIHRTWIAAWKRGDFEEGMRRGRHAAAALERLGGSDDLEGDLADVLGVLHIDRDPANALAWHRRSLALKSKVHGPSARAVAAVLVNEGSALHALRRNEESLAVLQRAAAIFEHDVGPRHPETAVAIDHLGNSYRRAGNFTAAMGHLRRALAIKEEALGADHVSTAITVNNIGVTLRLSGKPREAVPYFRRALAVLEQKRVGNQALMASSLLGLGKAYLSIGDPAQALPLLERALAIGEKHRKGDVLMASAELALAKAVWRVGKDRARSLRLARAALERSRRAGAGAEDLAPIEGWVRSPR